MAFLSTRVMLVFGVCMVALHCAAAMSYTVGDTSGWTVPAGNKLYDNWIVNKTFNVGDSLVFTFTTNSHNVLEVTKTNYDNCNSASPTKSYTTGPATVNLTASGAQYFICGVGSHCSNGQKLAITVSAASTASPTPSPTSSPSPLSPPSPPSSSPTPSPSSSPPPSASPPSASPPPSASSPSASPPPATPETPPTGSSTPTPTGSNSASPTESASNASYRSISPLTAWMGMLSGVAAVIFVL